MLRKNIRLRREYLFHKEQEKDKQAKYEKKLQLKNAILCNFINYFIYVLNKIIIIAKKHMPTELYKEKDALQKQLQLDDDNTISFYFRNNFLLKKTLKSS